MLVKTYKSLTKVTVNISKSKGSDVGSKAVYIFSQNFKRLPVPLKFNLPSTSKERDQPSISSVTLIQADLENHLLRLNLTIAPVINFAKKVFRKERNKYTPKTKRKHTKNIADQN